MSTTADITMSFTRDLRPGHEADMEGGSAVLNDTSMPRVSVLKPLCEPKKEIPAG